MEARPKRREALRLLGRRHQTLLTYVVVLAFILAWASPAAYATEDSATPDEDTSEALVDELDDDMADTGGNGEEPDDDGQSAEGPDDRESDEAADEDDAVDGDTSGSSDDPTSTLELRSSDFLLIFPIAGRISYIDSWGAPRSGGRTHKGTDIFAEKGTPVVAAAAGEVIAASVSDGTAGVYVKIRHANGAVSVYLHLNNDTPGTDDGAVVGIASGIEKGVFVPAGRIIGYVGDSGNAETTQPHLHFEYRLDGTNAVNPFPLLQSVQGPVRPSSSHTQDTTLPFTGEPSTPLALLALAMVIAGTLLLLRARSFGYSQHAKIATASIGGSWPPTSRLIPRGPGEDTIKLSTRQLTRVNQEP